MNTAPQQLEGADGTINGKLAPAVISNTAQSNGRPNQYASNINPTGRGAPYPNNNRINTAVTNRGGASTQHRAGNWNANSRVGGQGYEGKQQFTSAVQANGDPTVNGGSLYQPVIPGAAQRNAPIRVQSAPPNLAEQQAAQTPVPVETNIPLDTQQMPQSQFIPHKTMLYAAPNMNYYPYAPPFMYPPYPMPAGRGVPTQPMPGTQLRPQQVMPQPTQPGQQAPPGSVPVQQPRYHPHSMGQAGQLLGMPPSYIANRGMPMGAQPQQRQPVAYPGQPYMNAQPYPPPNPNVVTNVIPPPQQGKKRIEIRDPHTKELINVAGLKTASAPTENTEEQHPVQPVAAALATQANPEKPEPASTNAIINDPTIPGSAKKPETESLPTRKAVVLQNPVSRETIELGPAHKSTPPALKPLHAETSDNKDQTARNDAEPQSHAKTLVDKASSIETTGSSPVEVNKFHAAKINGGEGSITPPKEAEQNGVAAPVELPKQQREEQNKDKSGEATSNEGPGAIITAIPTDDSFANSEDASLHITESDQVTDSLDLEAVDHSFDEQDGESSIFSDNAESNDPEDWELKDDDELTNIKGNKQVVQKPTQLVSEKSSDGFQIRQYDRNFMLSFQDRFKQKPDGMALIDDVINTGLDGGGRAERSNLMMSGGSQSYRKGGSQSRSQLQGGFNRPVAQKVGSMNMGSKPGSLRRSSGSNRNLKPKTPPPSSSSVPVAPLIPSKDRWVPSKARQITESEVVVRKVMGLLNKITVETFASISDQIISSGITSSEILRSVIQQVYEKAVSEPHFSTLYATLCRKLAAKTKMFEEAGEKTSFKRILLNRCQEEFEKKQDISQLSGLSDIERAEADMKMRKRMKGNVKFIGELFKQKMLSEQIMHECILRLVGNVNAPVPADIEALCKLLTTIGGLIDHQDAKPKLDVLFVQLNQLSNSTVLEPRICFMLKDVIELRERNWIPRREEAKPTTIKEVRTQAMDKDLHDSRFSGKAGSATLTPQKILSNPNVRASSGRSSPPLTQTQQPSANEWAIAGAGKSRSGKPESKNTSSKYQQNQSSTTPMVLGPRSSNSMVSGAAGWNQKGGAPAGASTTNGGRGASSSNAAGAGASSNAKLAPGGGNRFQALAGASGTSPEKKPSKPIISKEKLEEDTVSLLEEFLVNDDLEEAIACTRELVECCSPDMIGDIIFHTISFALEKKENEVFKCAEYVSNAMKRGVISVKSFLQGVSQMIEIFEDIAVDIPTAPKSLGIVLGSAVDTESLRLADAFEQLKPLSNKSPGIKADYGMAERIAGELLQSLSLAMEKHELQDMYSISQFDIKDLFRSNQRNEDHLQEFAARNNISFLFPLLGVTKEIGAKLKEGIVDIDGFMAWAKANIPVQVARKNPNFVSQVFKMVLDSTSSTEGSVDIKTQLTSIKKLTPFLQHLLNGNIAAQVSAVFLLQAHWTTHKSQPAALKQMFHFFYQQEIISEEAFDQWANDTHDVGEQKQHALLDVNPFLTWLETAEEEEEEEEEEKKSSPAQ